MSISGIRLLYLSAIPQARRAADSFELVCCLFSTRSHIFRNREMLGDDAIQCDLARMPPTKNTCFELESRMKQLGPIKTWIGPICINQNDSDERPRHIELLENAHSYAPTTHLWLGEGNITSDHALHNLVTSLQCF
ncbi:hypothetical protein F5Y12DRAFT_541260 [Xylaria sp. FL1777]|nr:hypothetical protein F5Y12DRAFT_541260 [Xylaria sp. FL1777]